MSTIDEIERTTRLNKARHDDEPGLAEAADLLRAYGDMKRQRDECMRLRNIAVEASADERSMTQERLGEIEFAVAYAGADAAPTMNGVVHKMLRDCLAEMARLRNLVGEWKAAQARAVDAESAVRDSLNEMALRCTVARRDAILEAADWLNEKHPDASAALTGLGNSCPTCRVWPCACDL